MKSIHILLISSLVGMMPARNVWAWYDEPYRPQFHFSRPSVTIGDPCGMVKYQGLWHIFTWDQATSSDLVYWSIGGWPFLQGVANTSFFTGSAAVDLQNSSGFGSPGSPPMVLAVTFHNNQTSQESIGIYSSTDYVNFNYYSGDPVIAGPPPTFRDSDVSWDDQHGLWVMLVAHNNQIYIYGSSDLKNWQLKSVFGPVNGGGQNFECPGMAQIPVKGVTNLKKWVLYSGPGTHNCMYWVGSFDGTTFTPDGAPQAQAQLIESPDPDFYAARVFRDYDGGQCLYMWAWMDSWAYAGSVPTSFGSGYTIIRKLQLVWTSQGYVIAQEPHPGLQSLRGPVVNAAPRNLQGTVNLTEFQPSTNTYEIIANFKLTPQSQKVGFNLCVGGTTNKVVLGYDVGAGNLFLDRTASGNVSFSSSFPSVRTVSYSPPNGLLKFHIFVDQDSIEVFINGGEIVFTDLIYPASTSLGIQLFSDNAVTVLQSLNAWMLKSVWH